MKEDLFDFSTALTYLKEGRLVENEYGNVFKYIKGKIMCYPRGQYPKGARQEVRLYWDSVLSNSWKLFTED